jgi:hypothetical protein
MVSVPVSINIPVEMFEKSRTLRINRSAIARDAISKELDRIEKEKTGAAPSTVTAPAAHSPEAISEERRSACCR